MSLDVLLASSLIGALDAILHYGCLDMDKQLMRWVSAHSQCSVQ